MIFGRILIVGATAAALLLPGLAAGEILAMFNYESKPEQSLKKLKMSGTGARREGIAIVDVDPKSPNYGKLLVDMPLPNDSVAHHIFYNKDNSKGYVTSLGKTRIYVIDLKQNPFRIKQVEVPQCKVGEDVVFSQDNKTWYLTCMGSGNVVYGDAVNDTVTGEIKLPVKYPHGIHIHEGIDRMLVTDTVRASDLGDAGDTIGVIELSTGKSLGTIKVSNKPSPAGAAPVEVLFKAGSNPPLAYVTNMFGGHLWYLQWNAAKKTFDSGMAFDFNKIKAGVPLEIYFNRKGDRMYITTAKPGKFHIFDVSGDLRKPKLLKTIEADEGAHHVSITPDEKLAWVQNSLMNLPGMSSGTVTVIDLENQKRIGELDTFSKLGLNLNLIVLLPKWYHPIGH